MYQDRDSRNGQRSYVMDDSYYENNFRAYAREAQQRPGLKLSKYSDELMQRDFPETNNMPPKEYLQAAAAYRRGWVQWEERYIDFMREEVAKAKAENQRLKEQLKGNEICNFFDNDCIQRQQHKDDRSDASSKTAAGLQLASLDQQTMLAVMEAGRANTATTDQTHHFKGLLLTANAKKPDDKSVTPVVAA